MSILKAIYRFFEVYRLKKNRLRHFDDNELLKIYTSNPDSFSAGVADKLLKERGWSHEKIRNYKKRY
ncbi:MULTISPECIES: hypothetical protein [unclassified Vibrio]|uniref:hypothetical protein n=1 Tax=unclassified Vibrio TaxID=2614977 RepID=UPI000B8E7F2B|nr:MULTISPECIES: hypothetical protein [unclassified Vibrio]OXX24495.1 hypothetical protein B9J88_05675 [Vibrio sp. V05_P4A8T149]OXX29253.1 hypothetical protein B9J95_13920 [Vibrio sp. V14_P6S14T42]OXX30137.1 hypothetical protein B9J81_16675 [Vibrio sp. V04_P4A5T148]OXX51633.1 hypothetical protein B9J91_16800 [Vibrio sp. V18_P1S4T112]